MAWSGGNYTKGNNATGGWVGDASLGIGIEAGRHDIQDDDFATGINQCLNKDGSNAATGPFNAGGFKLTNIIAGTVRTDGVPVGQLQDGGILWGGTSGGSANAQTITLSPTLTAYVAGQTFRFKAGFTNSGNTTLNVNGIGAVALLSSATGGQIAPGQLVANLVFEVIYDGTQFQLINPASLWTAFTPSLSQSASVSFTNNYSKYIVNGKTVFFQCSLVATSAGTAANAITVSLPVATSSASVFRVIGSASFYDANVTTMYNLAAYTFSTTSVGFTGDTTGGNAFGAVPAVTIAVGDYVNLAVTYEAA